MVQGAEQFLKGQKRKRDVMAEGGCVPEQGFMEEEEHEDQKEEEQEGHGRSEERKFEVEDCKGA